MEKDKHILAIVLISILMTINCFSMESDSSTANQSPSFLSSPWTWFLANSITFPTFFINALKASDAYHKYKEHKTAMQGIDRTSWVTQPVSQKMVYYGQKFKKYRTRAGILGLLSVTFTGLGNYFLLKPNQTNSHCKQQPPKPPIIINT